jgi:hypothetical protein
LTYEIVVKNTGNVKIDDVEVTDTAPSGVTIKEVTGDGKVEGQKITWPKFALSESEEISFFITVQVKADADSGRTLTNVVKARSEDKGISATDTDTTVVEVERKPQVAAKTDGPKPVPVSARTGAGALGALATLLGGSGLSVIVRRTWL